MKHPIPDDALDDRLGFVGTAGSGKTYGTGTCVERLLDRKARVVVIDPLDVWWGLRLIADGSSSSRYSMPIFGGAGGDHRRDGRAQNDPPHAASPAIARISPSTNCGGTIWPMQARPSLPSTMPTRPSSCRTMTTRL